MHDPHDHSRDPSPADDSHLPVIQILGTRDNCNESGYHWCPAGFHADILDVAVCFYQGEEA